MSITTQIVRLNIWTAVMALAYVLGYLMSEWWPEKGYLLGMFVGVTLSICVLGMVENERA